ncbi:MAG: hypothetical protein RI988_2606 [Pseudomonadota bacterium]|jgi:hypothetical protein
MSSSDGRLRRCATRGGVAVEFALVVTLFVGAVLATIDLSRWIFAIVSAGEAARVVARQAAVCSPEAAATLQSRSAPWLDGVQGGTLAIHYLPAGCTAQQAGTTPACAAVQVTLRGYSAPGGLWLLDSLPVPPALAYLTRESLDSADNASNCY